MNRLRGIYDPTLPRKPKRRGNAKQRNQVEGSVEGWLVDMGGGEIVLTDTDGNLWPAERVRTLTGTFGFGLDGLSKSPRPYLYDAQGAVVIEGDHFLVHFLKNDPNKPVISGGVRSLKPADPGWSPPQPIGEDPNPVRFRAALLSSAGAMTGHVQVAALDGGPVLEVVVGGGTFGTGLRLELDYSAGTVKIGRGSETHQVAFGEVIVQALADLAADVLAVNTAIPTLTPVPVLNATTLAIDTAQSLAAGAPMLSTVVKVE